jgi:glutamate dehydrogenase/leucine dehydrogenase
LSDISGGIYNPNGIDVESAWTQQTLTGSIADLPGTEKVTNDELLLLDVDWLIPAALGGVIDSRNAGKIKAKVIVEAANHPVTPVADAALVDAGVTVIPDIIANAGGVTVSYCEWTQNIQQFRWEEEQVNERLQKVMRKAYADIASYAENKSLSLREAAFAIAVERVARAAHLRGYV